MATVWKDDEPVAQPSGGLLGFMRGQLPDVNGMTIDVNLEQNEEAKEFRLLNTLCISVSATNDTSNSPLLFDQALGVWSCDMVHLDDGGREILQHPEGEVELHRTRRFKWRPVRSGRYQIQIHVNEARLRACPIIEILPSSNEEELQRALQNAQANAEKANREAELQEQRAKQAQEKLDQVASFERNFAEKQRLLSNQAEEFQRKLAELEGERKALELEKNRLKQNADLVGMQSKRAKENRAHAETIVSIVAKAQAKDSDNAGGIPRDSTKPQDSNARAHVPVRTSSSYRTIDGCRAFFLDGNILDVEADAMVVSHSNLFRWSKTKGIQPHLMRKLQDSSEKVVKFTETCGGPMVGIGQVVFTDAGGELKVKKLIHLVTIIQGANWFGKYHYTTPDELAFAIFAALNTAEAENLRRIAIPSVMAKDYSKGSDQEIEQCIWEACKRWIDEKSPKSLKEIALVRFSK
jgi:O-acetyl-ADP-ribose deacetylase (regulator of RNase III)